jgi:hypothetical protein
MPCYEFAEKWTWTTVATTGAMDARQVRGRVERFTFGFQTDAGCTCTVQMQAGPESTGPWASLMAAANLGTSAFQVQQMSGPLAWVRPYVTAKTTGVLTVEAFGN